ncbi:4Fe-4S dicluster domain-containing protein [Salinispira pacifica]
MPGPFAGADPITGGLLQLLVSVTVTAAIGGVIALTLAALSRAFAVKRDERAARISALLPGLDCSRCGHGSCAEYARAVSRGENPGLCMPGGQRTARMIGAILGVEVHLSGPRTVAQVHCRGGRDVSRYRFAYRGLSECSALYMLYGGDKECAYSCLGLGSCIPVCPAAAIGYDDTGRVRVDRDLCISCGLCLDVCPTGVLKMIPADADVVVACNSPDPAEKVAEYCSVGCTGCRLCERHSPAGGYRVRDNLCTIDYDQRGDRRAGMNQCPTGTIIPAAGLKRLTDVITKREVHE